MEILKSELVNQHNLEINENKLQWLKKPVLRLAYEQFYLMIRSLMAPELKGLVVELGSGMGNIKQYIPECITTDLFANHGVDRVENAYRLSFPDSSVSHLILFDVWHHIEYPANALEEFRRVLVPNGRIILCEPAMSLAGRVVYGRCHHEPLGFSSKFSDKAIKLTIDEDTRYFASQSSCHRLILTKELPQLLASWKVTSIHQVVSFAYWGSGGFRGPQLYPDAAYPMICFIDKVLGMFPSIFAARIVASLAKTV